MDAAKRRVVIKQRTAKKKEVEGQQPKETSTSNPSSKRKLPEKQGRLPKKPKKILEPVMGLEVEGRKTVAPAKHGAGKGLMKGPSTTQEKPPVLLREDSKYALEKFSSIMSFDDYEDACSLPSAGDRSNIFLGVPRSNHKERGKFKDNVIKKTFGEDEE